MDLDTSVLGYPQFPESPTLGFDALSKTSEVTSKTIYYNASILLWHSWLLPEKDC